MTEVNLKSFTRFSHHLSIFQGREMYSNDTKQVGNKPNGDLWRNYFGLNYIVTVNHHVLNDQNGATYK